MDVRFEERGAFTVVAMSRDFNGETMGQIPDLWCAFTSRMWEVEGLSDEVLYGLNDVPEDLAEGMDFRYSVAGEVPAGTTSCPEGFSLLEIPAARYAVFTHVGPAPGVAAAFQHIHHTWMPASEYECDGVLQFERYDERFDPEDACDPENVIEIWFPVKPRGT